MFAKSTLQGSGGKNIKMRVRMGDEILYYYLKV